MSNVIIDKWNKMYKLISHHKLIINCDVNDDYKCGICKNILINAHQAICGCNFCYECINQYMTNGAVNCPNNTEECKLESLSNIASNHKMNKLISKLIVKCSNQMCSHECQLIEMENHLNSCFNKSMKFPFKKVGCEHEDMIDDQLNDHMLSDIHNHNKILIDLIGNLRYEMEELKEKIDENRLEIELLKENDQRKNEVIESLKEEIKLIKQKNEELTQQMEIGDRYLWCNCDEIDIETNHKGKKDKLFKEFIEKFDMKIVNMKQEWNEKLDEQVKKIKEKNEILNIERSNKIDKYLNMRDNGRLEWRIDKLNEIKLMISEYFYDKQNPYKMYLRLENINNELNIWMHISSGAFDDDLQWPCQVEMTIYIHALNDDDDDDVFKTISKLCRLEKPTNNSVKWSDPIKISYFDWSKSNLNNKNCLLVCMVNFK